MTNFSENKPETIESTQHPAGGILAFYLSQHPDNVGRKIEDIWQWDYQKLGGVHNYIQWLFPLLEKSRFNSDAPVLTEPVIAAFRSSNELQKRLGTSFRVLLNYYGLECGENEGKIKIIKSAQYPQRKKTWVSPRNHNYLRITRILTSLTLLGLKNHAKAFLSCLEEIYQEEGAPIGIDTYTYWKNALKISPN